MWIVTEDGFFNIIQYQEDKELDLLTLKARRGADLVQAAAGIFGDDDDYNDFIEESDDADYKYRMKAQRWRVVDYIASKVRAIDYPKTKDALNAAHPDRAGIYLAVWDTLSELQDE